MHEIPELVGGQSVRFLGCPVPVYINVIEECSGWGEPGLACEVREMCGVAFARDIWLIALATCPMENISEKKNGIMKKYICAYVGSSVFRDLFII